MEEEFSVLRLLELVEKSVCELIAVDANEKVRMEGLVRDRAEVYFM